MFDLNQELYNHSQQNLSEAENSTLEQVFSELNLTDAYQIKKKTSFILPFIRLGLNAEQITGVVNQIPAGWSWDHREMYFDFRLARWIRHIEPKDLHETLKEYLDNAQNLEEGVLYIQKALAQLTQSYKHP